MSDTHNEVSKVLEERGKVYGDAVDMHTRIAEMWTVLLGHEVRPEDVALCMVGLKMIRALEAPDHWDNYLDMKGYTQIAEDIVKRSLSVGRT